jgi:hypothetical protein
MNTNCRYCHRRLTMETYSDTKGNMCENCDNLGKDVRQDCDIYFSETAEYTIDELVNSITGIKEELKEIKNIIREVGEHIVSWKNNNEE